MAEKGSQHGEKVNYLSLLRLDRVIARVVSYQKRPRPVHILKFPLGVHIGNVTYTVQSAINPVTFKKRKDAEQFSKLLKHSVNGYKSDIVRREITDEGYHVD